MPSQKEILRVRKHERTQHRAMLLKLRPLDDLTLALAERRGYELSHVAVRGSVLVLVRTCAEHGWGGTGSWDVVRHKARIATVWTGKYPFRDTEVAYRAHPIDTAHDVACERCHYLNAPIIDKATIDGAMNTTLTASIRVIRADTDAADPLTIFPYPDEPLLYLGCGYGLNPNVSMWGELPRDSSIDEFAASAGQVELPWHQLPASTRAHIRKRIG